MFINKRNTITVLAFSILLCSQSFFSNAQTDSAADTTLSSGFRRPGMTKAQQLIANTGEDLLTGNNGHEGQTVISGYGEAVFKRDNKYKNASASLDRGVLFIGHQFSNRIAFFSELEIENARIEGGKLKGAIGFEQLFLKFSLNPRQYFVAGLFLPRIGILNENHLPINYNGTERTMVETFIIPSTWRELGIAFYGQMTTMPVTYMLSVMNGVNAQNFTHGTGIAGGRGEGQMVSMNNLAVTGAVQAYVGNFRFQVSGYVGGTIPFSQFQSDSLKAPKGVFAAPMYLGEADAQYTRGGFYGKLLGTYIALPDANEINSLFANNTPSSMYGTYLEVGYNLFQNFKKPKWSEKQLIAFARYERLNMNNSIPVSGIQDGTLDQSHFLAGFCYYPLPNVVLKADMRFTHTGPQNKALFLNPPPVMMPYQQNNSFINLGIGYSF
jgi:hypothetical protein